MAEERPDDPGPSPDSRPKRAPPTIDLQATEISSEPSRTEATEEAAKEKTDTLVDYASSQAKRGEPMALDALSELMDDEAPRAFYDYIRNKDI